MAVSFKTRMNVSVSNAETIIHQALSERNLTYGYVTQIGFEFTQEEIETFHVYGTVVDGIWKEHDFIVFYDGQPHLKQHQIGKDEEIQACLEHRGWTVQRFPYQAPISSRRLAQIVDAIEEMLRQKGYFNSSFFLLGEKGNEVHVR